MDSILHGSRGSPRMLQKGRYDEPHRTQSWTRSRRGLDRPNSAYSIVATQEQATRDSSHLSPEKGSFPSVKLWDSQTGAGRPETAVEQWVRKKNPASQICCHGSSTVLLENNKSDSAPQQILTGRAAVSVEVALFCYDDWAPNFNFISSRYVV